VRCFDYLGTLTTSGCVALAALNDSGVVAACEGDVASAVAMVLVRALLGEPSWMANPAVIDTEGDRLLLAHCTVAPSMVEDVELHTHFESGLGIGLRGRFAPGWVTLVRLGGSALEHRWIAEAEVVETGSADDLCRTQVTVRLAGARAATLLEAPLGNHLLLVRGRHRQRLEEWWQLAFG
jgi:L-fucose isomerase-like protein